MTFNNKNKIHFLSGSGFRNNFKIDPFYIGLAETATVEKMLRFKNFDILHLKI